jgi:ParB-like chromosome segregation protein Spo0J
MPTRSADPRVASVSLPRALVIPSKSDKTMNLTLEHIETNGGTQTRAAVHAEVVESYAEEMKGGADFPPIVVFFDGKEYWLADGFHRLIAARGIGWKSIQALVRQGTRREAVLYSAGANARHGLRRSNADKRRAVEILLRDEEWGKWSDREISRRCAVSADLVAEIRRFLTVDSDSERLRLFQTKHGTSAKMDTAKIGPKAEPAERAEPDEREAEEAPSQYTAVCPACKCTLYLSRPAQIIHTQAVRTIRWK